MAERPRWPDLDRSDLAIVAGAAAVVGAGFAAERVAGLPGLMRDLGYPPSFRYFLWFLWLPLPFAFLVGRLRVRDEGGRYVTGWAGWRAAAWRFLRQYLAPARILGAAGAGLAVCLVINTYGSWKRVIPRVQPFSWDGRLADLDRWLHLGRHPWEWLQPLLGRPGVTLALDTIYYTWLPLFAAMVAWQAWTGRRDLRFRFFVTLIFVWVGLGNVAATAFSSAGPCYYAHVAAGPDPYQPLFEYLRGVPRGGGDLLALRGQALLWDLYQSGRANPYTGISAMPSVHVAMPVLYALALGARSRVLGALFGLYALAILIATVHLGWHYAVDGYASVLAVLLVWRLSARWAGRPAA